MSWDLSDGSGRDPAWPGVKWGQACLTLPPYRPVTGPPADPAVGSHCQGPAGGWRKKGAAGRGGRTGTQPPGHPREKASQALCPTQGCWEGEEAGKVETVVGGEAGRGGQPPGAGRPWGEGAVRLPGSRRGLGSTQPRDPYPAQAQNWFLDWQRQGGRGQEEAKRSGGQQACRSRGGPPGGTPGTRWHHSLSQLWGGLPGVGADPVCCTDALPHTPEPPQGPTVRPAPHLSQVRLAQPGETPGWTRSSWPLLPPHNTPRLLRSRGEGQGSQQAWGGPRGAPQSPLPFIPRHKGPGRPSSIHLVPVAALCRDRGSEGLTSAPPPLTPTPGAFSTLPCWIPPPA